MNSGPPRIGVVIVSYASQQIIDECLESLFASRDVDLRVVVVDNHSSDASCATVLDWASGRVPYVQRKASPLPASPTVTKPISCVQSVVGAPVSQAAPLTLLRSPINGGYAYAVNHGLRLLLADSAINLFWVLNPDCVVPPETAAMIAATGSDLNFSLLGGRTIYYERPNEVQTDGGLVSRWTGRCVSLHSGMPTTVDMPDAESLDYITGASVIVTRTFIETAGLMVEDYFLYYEEVDWAFRRGTRPLRVSADIIVYHRGGTVIGSGSTVRRASPFANYFNYRNRMRFVRRFMPWRTIPAAGFSVMKALQLALKGGTDEAAAVIAGSFSLPPPRAVRDRVADGETQVYAFGKAVPH